MMKTIIALILMCASSAFAAATFTCNAAQAGGKPPFVIPLATGYLVGGSCTSTGTATATGDSFTSLNNDICGSASRFPKDILFGVATVPGGGAASIALAPSWDSSTSKVLFVSTGAGGINTAFTVNAVATTAVVFRYWAICT